MEDSPTNLQPEPLAAEPVPVRRAGIFIGPHGLYAGWRFALFNFLFVLSTTAILSVKRLLSGRAGVVSFAPHLVIGQELLLLAGLGLALAVMFKIERRAFQFDFLPLKGFFGRNFWVGMIFGFGALSALLLSLRGLHDFYFGPPALHGSAVVKFALLWALAFFLVGIFEESFSRGYALRTLASGMGFWPAAAVTSLLFGAIHISNGGEQWLGIASVVAIAFFFCFTIWRTGTLWFAVGCHFAWDYAETFVFGVPDSGEVATGHLLSPQFHGSHWITGGSVGPEGSALVFVVYGLMALIFNFVYPERKLAGDFLHPEPARNAGGGALPPPTSAVG